jgi:hypothetical protein
VCDISCYTLALIFDFLVNKGNESLISAFSSKKTDNTKKQDARLARHHSARRGSNATFIELVRASSSNGLVAPSFSQQLLKKAKSIPLKRKINAHYVSTKRQSVMLLQSNLNKSSAAEHMAQPLATTSEDGENHVRFAESVVPSSDHAKKKSQVVPCEITENHPPVSPLGSSKKSFNGFGMFTEFKKSSIQDIGKSINSIFAFGNPALFVR